MSYVHMATCNTARLAYTHTRNPGWLGTSCLPSCWISLEPMLSLFLLITLWLELSLHHITLFWTSLGSGVVFLYLSGRQRVLTVELWFRLSISSVTPPAPIETQPVRSTFIKHLSFFSIPANALAPVSWIEFQLSSRTVSLLLPDMASASSHVMSPLSPQDWRSKSVRLPFLRSNARRNNHKYIDHIVLNCAHVINNYHNINGRILSAN